MKLYLAGPMRGYKDFNFPAFHKAAFDLRCAGYEVFSPAEKDEERNGIGTFASETGNEAEIAEKGFSLRQALYDDTRYICLEAEGIAMMPGWEASSGARAEWALANALGHKVIYL